MSIIKTCNVKIFNIIMRFKIRFKIVRKIREKKEKKKVLKKIHIFRNFKFLI